MWRKQQQHTYFWMKPTEILFQLYSCSQKLNCLWTLRGNRKDTAVTSELKLGHCSLNWVRNRLAQGLGNIRMGNAAMENLRSWGLFRLTTLDLSEVGIYWHSLTWRWWLNLTSRGQQVTFTGCDMKKMCVTPSCSVGALELHLIWLIFTEEEQGSHFEMLFGVEEVNLPPLEVSKALKPFTVKSVNRWRFEQVNVWLELTCSVKLQC